MGKRRKRGVNGEPWMRAENQGWYIKVEGRKVALRDKTGNIIKGKDREAEAYETWHRMLAVANAPVNQDDNPLRVVLDLYLQYLKKAATEKTWNAYKAYFTDFLKKWPNLAVNDLKPRHMREWWDECHATWGDSTRNNSATAFKAALNWAKSAEGDNIITRNPLDGMAMPQMGRRGPEVLISDEDHDRLIRAVPEDLRLILIALRHTGTRPSNIWRATPRDFYPEKKCFMLGVRGRVRRHTYDPQNPAHKTQKKTGKVLIVPLTDFITQTCVGLLDRLRKEFPEDYLDRPLFRTAKGGSWDAPKLANRLLWYKRKLGLGHVICYGYRHTVGTHLIEGNVSEAKAAAVLGQDNPATLSRNYEHARAAALVATLAEHRQPSIGEAELLGRLTGTSTSAPATR